MALAKGIVIVNVDVIEAGFPASSEYEAELVGLIAQEYGHHTVVAALSRAKDADSNTAMPAIEIAEKHR